MGNDVAINIVKPKIHVICPECKGEMTIKGIPQQEHIGIAIDCPECKTAHVFTEDEKSMFILALVHPNEQVS